MIFLTTSVEISHIQELNGDIMKKQNIRILTKSESTRSLDNGQTAQ